MLDCTVFCDMLVALVCLLSLFEITNKLSKQRSAFVYLNTLLTFLFVILSKLLPTIYL